MSKESRQRLREAKLHPHEKKFRWLLPFISIACIAAGFFVWQHSARNVKQPAVATVPAKPATFKMPASYAELCAVSTNDLEKCDIALMNLLCAEGLHGAESLNVTDCLATLDRIAASVKFNTTRASYKFRDHPEQFNDSEGYFDMMMLATVIQQDFNIHYNPAHIEMPGQALEADNSFFADSQDVFIHGLARPDGLGTCSSMPIFYVAVGRRLGYPLKLVKAKGHLFARWDDRERSFNIECTSIGFVSHTDEEYRTWPASFTPEEETSESYLKSLTPAQELAVFLSIRGQCLRASGDLKRSLGSFAQAFYREPQSVGNQKLFARAEYEAYKAGILPKRGKLQYELRTLGLPEGPMKNYFASQKAALQARNMVEGNVDDVEMDLMILKSEIERYQKAPLQGAAQAIQSSPR
jgi:hypothetical protein